MKVAFTFILLAMVVVMSKTTFAIISGPAGGCIGATHSFYDTLSPPGVWSSSNPSIATINATTGAVTGIMAGAVTISYIAGSVVETQPYIVTAAPAPVTGGMVTFCQGSSITLSDATPGGTWISEGSSIATVGSATGIVTGVSGGDIYIHYYSGPGCSVYTNVTVNPIIMPDSVIGALNICPGATDSFFDYIPGGVWSSSNPAVASVSATGIVTGLSLGTSIITYSITNSCGTGYRTSMVTITTVTPPPTITGTTTLYVGDTTNLVPSVWPGIFSSSNTAIATIDTFGYLAGTGAGICDITYTIPGCSSAVNTVVTITVNALNAISGNVLFTGTPFYGDVEVWLIKYDPSTFMLTAADSMIVYATGSAAHYQFTGMSSDLYRVKAGYVSDTTGLSTGYVPTYHPNSLYWNSATVISHTFGTANVNKDITMNYGSAVSGPGFIGGDVTMGANRGTSGTIPSPNLLILAENASTGAIMQRTFTNSAGHYSFNNLPVGTYKIYPELINYATTPFTSINITATSPSMTAASFEQHTISHTITPAVTAIAGVNEQASFINAFPNPTSGILNINYNIAAAEQANVTIADVTGRQVYNATIDMNKGAGTSQVDLSSLANGIYMVTVSSASVNYNNKIQVQK